MKKEKGVRDLYPSLRILYAPIDRGGNSEKVAYVWPQVMLFY